MESDDDIEVEESVGFVMDGSKALADKVKEALEQDKDKEKKEVICNNVKIITLSHEMEDAGKYEDVDEVIKNVKNTEEVTDEIVETDTNCEDVIRQEMAEVQHTEVMEQLTRPGDIQESFKLEMKQEMEKTEVKDFVDMGAEWAGKAQVSFLEEEKEFNKNR